MKKTEDFKQKIIDISLMEAKETSKYHLDMMYLALKVFKTELNYLDNNKPSRFSKKKMEEYIHNHELLENSIKTFNEAINQELKNLSNLSDN